MTQPTTLPRFVAAGEALTDIIRTGPDTWVTKVGGATWNVGRVMAKLGVPSGFAGAISKDVFGQALHEATEAAGLDMRFLQQPAKSPLLAIVHETQPPKYFFIGDDSADLHFDPSLLPAGWMDAVEWVHFCGVSLARQPLADKLVALAAELKSHGVKISYDPNFRLMMDEQYDPILEKMTKLADIVKVSDEDLVGLFRHDDIDASFDKLRSWNPESAYLYTRGEQGASIHIGTQSWHCKPPKIEVIDSVGAGDASIGGLLYSVMYHADRSWEEHLRFSVAAGAGGCLSAGANPPSVELIDSLYAQTVATSL
ncbi:carbohydrate kinase [Leeia sp. TBRC 13508]|uniref:Carbohydrate kinase n=1 Tax=Leeia speluncae TaxID=2884804 RepID=A0ABS8DAR4_9NEIS|nr:carbohydrate kinase [Leeia speluncae]MCB6185302.1 carbohydrate kinase [Leeia speluncae]